MRPSWRRPLPAPLAWLLIACVPQILVTLAATPPGVWSQVAGASALMTITAILTLGLLARTWSDAEARVLAGQTVWAGCCLIGALDAYLCARGLLGWERALALMAAAAVGVVLLRCTARASRLT